MRLYSSGDDDNTRIAAYESMLDLLTLISFILIFAAMIYASRAAGRDQNSAAVVAEIAEHGDGAPMIPADVLLTIIYREQSVDKLAIVDGATGNHQAFDVTVDGVGSVLDGVAQLFDSAANIDVAFYRRDEDVNPGVYLAVSRWLASHGHNKYHVYYAGEPGQ